MKMWMINIMCYKTLLFQPNNRMREGWVTHDKDNAPVTSLNQPVEKPSPGQKPKGGASR